MAIFLKMSSKLLPILKIWLGLSIYPLTVIAGFVAPPGFTIDVHNHVIPPIWREALIAGGYPVIDGTLYTDGFPVPNWSLPGHIASMDLEGVNYGIISISAPGVSFLAHNPAEAASLARSVNNEFYNYTQEYPNRLGALCVLPLPDVEAALIELEYCLDTLGFDGVGTYSNSNGTYLGDPLYAPIMAALESRNATLFVHPAAPGCGGASIGYSDPMSEYPFESVRAMENLLLTGQRAIYSQLNIIFPHGGGTMPYLAERIAEVAFDVYGTNLLEAAQQLASYYFDTASATTAIQLNAMTGFFNGVSKIVVGTDYPYVPAAVGALNLASTQANGGFTQAHMAQINAQNALGLFPRIGTKLGFATDR